MPHRRHTITVATSALFLVCLMLHAQAGPASQAFTPYNGVEAYKVYQALPGDWTRTVAHARRLLLQARAGRTGFRLSPPEPAALQHSLFGSLDLLVALNKWQGLSERHSSFAPTAILSPAASHTAWSVAILHTVHRSGNLSAEDASNASENSDGLLKNMRWMGAPRAWAS
jgi:hypothetical protein